MKAKVGEHYSIGGSFCTVPDRCERCGALLPKLLLVEVEGRRAADPMNCAIAAYCEGCAQRRKEAPR